MFIAKKWLDEARLRLPLTNFYLGQKHVASKINQGGGLVLLWKSDFDISVFTSSLKHIDTVIIAGMENSWRYTSFYCFPETHKHPKSWNVFENF